MCNRARLSSEPETLRTHFGADWLAGPPNTPTIELYPRKRAPVIRVEAGRHVIDQMEWDLLGGGASYPMTNVRDLKRWRPRLEHPGGRCLVPLTEFAEFTPDKHDLGDGKPPLKGEMWFSVTDQPLFAVAGVWQRLGDKHHFAMLTCDPNELVAPIHPKAMITILRPEDHARWLGGSYADAVELQRPYPADRMMVRGPVFPTRAVKAKDGHASG